MKENAEAMTGMNPPEGIFNLQTSSTSNDEGDHMGGMGSPTAVQSGPGTVPGSEDMHKVHPHAHHKVKKIDPQPQGHDLRHHHGYDLRARSFSK